MSRKLALLEAELQNTKKDFDGQIHELLVQLSEAQMRHEDVKAVFVGQLEQVKEEQELAVAEVSPSGCQTPSSTQSRKESCFPIHK
jgi:hypothetical protein